MSSKTRHNKKRQVKELHVIMDNDKKLSAILAHPCVQWWIDKNELSTGVFYSVSMLINEGLILDIYPNDMGYTVDCHVRTNKSSLQQFDTFETLRKFIIDRFNESRVCFTELPNFGYKNGKLICL